MSQLPGFDPNEELAKRQAEANPQQFVQDTNRWSYHLANDPYGGAAGAWAKQYYDNPNADPNAAIQSQISAFRSQYGSAAPADDVGVMNMIASGQRPQTQSQTSSQSWTQSPGPASATSNELLELLMQRARQGAAVGRDDPNVRAQVDPFVAQQERASRNYLDDIAERAGGRPINMQGEQRMASERLGQIAGGFEGEVIGREISSRRQEIQDALAQWGDMLSNEQRLALERELGYLNDSARTADRNTLNDQFWQDYSLKKWGMEQDNKYRWETLGSGG